MHDCFPKHSRMGTARIKQDKEIEEEMKKLEEKYEYGKK